MSSACVVVVATDDDPSQAQSLSKRLSLPLLSSSDDLPEACMAYLSYREGRLQLFPADVKQSGPVFVDFASNAAAHRLQSGGELIVKAVKGRSKLPLRVVDATAGLGRDSFVLAAYGFDVTLIERNAVIVALLDDGLRRAAQVSFDARVPIDAIVARMHLERNDALAYFAQLSIESPPDVIYLDPMFVNKEKFAHNEKNALVKKEMRLFRQLLEDEFCDESALLAVARANAKLRVVVKRALKALPLAESEPAYSLSGKAVRYDVYPS